MTDTNDLPPAPVPGPFKGVEADLDGDGQADIDIEYEDGKLSISAVSKHGVLILSVASILIIVATKLLEMW